MQLLVKQHQIHEDFSVFELFVHKDLVLPHVFGIPFLNLVDVEHTHSVFILSYQFSGRRHALVIDSLFLLFWLN